MPENMQMQAQPSMASLVGGIISDAQRLVRQEAALARREIQEELGNAKMAAVSVGAGAALAAFGVLMLCFMLVHLLHWATGGQDSAVIPLWGWFAIVGGVLVVFGTALLYAGKAKIGQIHVIPPQTAESIKENVQWLKNQT